MDKFTKDISAKILSSYPNHSPTIICVKDTKEVLKFIAGPEITIGFLMNEVRTRKKLKAYEALFMTVETQNKSVITASPVTLISDLYFKHVNPNGFLVLHAARENTFG